MRRRPSARDPDRRPRDERGRGRAGARAEVSHTYYVYVIEGRDHDGRPVLYVGQSSMTPERRLEEHRKGKSYCPGCKRRHYAKGGTLRLRRELYEHYNPVGSERARAERIETWLAGHLRKRGHRVVGGH